VWSCYATGSVSGKTAGGVIGVSESDDGSRVCQSLVALNTSVRASGGNVGRIVGYLSDRYNTLDRNYARSTGMTVQYNWNGSTGTDHTIDADWIKKDGADVSASNYNQVEWWVYSLYNEVLGPWDFDYVWGWNWTTNLPILRNMPEGAQNHTVQ
jgi:hypothetical protein